MSTPSPLLAADRSSQTKRSLRRPKRHRLLSLLLLSLPPHTMSVSDCDSDEERELEARRQRALAKPLRADDVLVPSASSLDPRSITPSPSESISRREQDIAAQSPNAYRPPNSRLRDLVSRDPPPPSLHFVLNAPLGTVGANRWAQVWRATAKEGDELVGPVVVKLLVETLFPDDPDDDWWQPAEEAVRAELAACIYSLFCLSPSSSSSSPQLQSLSSRSRSRRSSLLRRLSLRHALG
jgi:hypothetical protein